VQHREGVRVFGLGMLERVRFAGELDLDAVGVGEPFQSAERAAQQLPQLILSRQPERIGLGDRVQRPLGRAAPVAYCRGSIVISLTVKTSASNSGSSS